MYYVIYEQRLTQTVLNSVLACVSALACVGVLGGCPVQMRRRTGNGVL